VDVAVQRAKAAAPGVRVSAAMPVGAAPPVLLAEAEPACLVVVGCRGLGGFTGLMLGSTGVQLAGHAPCPVIVVRHDSDADGANAAGAAPARWWPGWTVPPSRTTFSGSGSPRPYAWAPVSPWCT
jgi:hypothetical protein